MTVTSCPAPRAAAYLQPRAYSSETGQSDIFGINVLAHPSFSTTRHVSRCRNYDIRRSIGVVSNRSRAVFVSSVDASFAIISRVALIAPPTT
jgi:hypothetical protein